VGEIFHTTLGLIQQWVPNLFTAGKVVGVWRLPTTPIWHRGGRKEQGCTTTFPVVFHGLLLGEFYLVLPFYLAILFTYSFLLIIPRSSFRRRFPTKTLSTNSYIPHSR